MADRLLNDSLPKSTYRYFVLFTLLVLVTFCTTLLSLYVSYSYYPDLDRKVESMDGPTTKTFAIPTKVDLFVNYDPLLRVVIYIEPFIFSTWRKIGAISSNKEILSKRDLRISMNTLCTFVTMKDGIVEKKVGSTYKSTVNARLTIDIHCNGTGGVRELATDISLINPFHTSLYTTINVMIVPTTMYLFYGLWVVGKYMEIL